MGMSIQGPMSGIEYPCQCPNGYVLVNKDADELIVYDRQPDGTYIQRGPAQKIVWDEKARKNIRRAQFEHSYDVLAYDAEEMGPWPAH